jgi:hypothetical protein
MGRTVTSFAIVSALCTCSLPAATVLFSDLGTGSNVYNTAELPPPNGIGWAIDGSTAPGAGGLSEITADLFTVLGTGSLPVTQIDLAVSNSNSSLSTFYASIWTDNSGIPGAEMPGAYWSWSTTNTGTCCSLVSVTGITGVDLTGGSQYFMVLGPLGLTDASSNYLNYNYGVSITGIVVGSTNGGSTWASDLDVPLGAFDVLNTPEPTTMALLGLGLAGVADARRAKASGRRS